VSDHSESLPVTVIGGYLGSGKTTLLNEILRSTDDRIAVIVNDFGDINIDASLIENQDGETLQLSNGCICCSLVEGFASAIATVLALEPFPDRLIIEASGVADPAQVAAYGQTPGLTLDSILVVVDAERIRTLSRDEFVGDTVLRQLAAADLVILNKTDLADPGTTSTTIDWLLTRATGAAVIAAEHGRVPHSIIFGDTGQTRTRLAPADTAAGPHSTVETFTTWSIAVSDQLTLDELHSLLDNQPDSVVRAKGLVLLEEDPGYETIVQVVGKRRNITRGSTRPAVPSPRLTFIATKLDC